ncbi:hypothetical protein JKP88DRAFT_276147 [Tribonema minus]|uniref:Uncharacterized protein n=1 Tax=Tribonema minus TaxID=303371 RepID=A0A835Z6L3_9STRA|nr:hypothetical protein JKP88DRAFT_276147 [Tribonema minus]
MSDIEEPMASAKVMLLADFTREFLLKHDKPWVRRPDLTQLIYSDDGLWNRLQFKARRDLEHDTARIRSRYQKLDKFIDSYTAEAGLRYVLKTKPGRAICYYLPGNT